MSRQPNNAVTVMAWCVAGLVAFLPSMTRAGSIADDAMAGFALCITHFGQPKEGRAVLKQAGWSFQGTAVEYQWLTKNTARSVVALGRNTGRPPQGCFVSYDGMTLQDAMALAEAEARRLNLTRTAIKESPVGVVWTGTVQGKSATLNVLKPTQYDRHSGAAIALLAD